MNNTEPQDIASLLGQADVRAMSDGELSQLVSRLVGQGEHYARNLNACHEMEKVLFTNDNTLEKKWIEYTTRIYQTTQLAIHATARQRCEAFVLTLGLSPEPSSIPVDTTRKEKDL